MTILRSGGFDGSDVRVPRDPVTLASLRAELTVKSGVIREGGREVLQQTMQATGGGKVLGAIFGAAGTIVKTAANKAIDGETNHKSGPHILTPPRLFPRPCRFFSGGGTFRTGGYCCVKKV